MGKKEFKAEPIACEGVVHIEDLIEAMSNRKLEDSYIKEALKTRLEL